MKAFTRQLGAEAGVQLNPLVDSSTIPMPDSSDQQFAIAMKSRRGRIDKAFLVNNRNLKRKLGAGYKIAPTDYDDSLEEAYIHVAEALNVGANSVIVSRLVANPVLGWVVAKASTAGTSAIFAVTGVSNNGTVTGVSISNGGAGFFGAKTAWVTQSVNGVVPANLTPAQLTVTVNPTTGAISGATILGGGSNFSLGSMIASSTSTFDADKFVSLTDSAFENYQVTDNENWILAIKHLECFDDGITVEFHVPEKFSNNGRVANDKIIVTLYDPKNTNEILYSFSGSLNPDSVDDFGISNYLPHVVERLTDEVIVVTNPLFTQIEPNSAFYGYTATGNSKVVRSGIQQSFSCDSDNLSLTGANAINDAIYRLENTFYDYAYLSSGGSQSPALLTALGDLAGRINAQLKFDVKHPMGAKTADAAIISFQTVAANLLASEKYGHLFHAFVNFTLSQDPTGVNGKFNLGVATYNIAKCCYRNSRKNTRGFAAKNFPIAGKDYPVIRTNMSQPYTPSQLELSRMAKLKLNPVVYETYTTGGFYVFRDSLTLAPVENSLRKLIAVADMSASVDDTVTKSCKDIIQLPMAVALQRMRDFLKDYFEAAQAAGWLVVGEGSAFSFEVIPDPISPYDSVIVNYWVRFDGTTRQIFATQTITR